MARLKAFYKCQQCGFTAAKAMGQCPDCSNWNTMIEEVIEVASKAAASAPARRLTDFSSAPTSLNVISKRSLKEPRTGTGILELDRLLGGGIVPGQVILLGGPPGIGKSTLMLQAAAALSGGFKVLYISGEESLKQISDRATRLGLKSDSLFLHSETDLFKIIKAIRDIKPGLVVLDSVQTVYHPELSGGPGSVSQVRECSAELLRCAKSSDAAVFLLGHVTKEGALAGPKILEHIVDTVLYFDNERHDVLRVLRAYKNRFGPTDEIGLFQMGEKGLTEVRNASSFFLEEHDRRALPGRAASVSREGSRPLLAEVQALVVATRYPLPRRMATGLDLNRVLVLLAAMEKHLRLRIEDKDVFVSIAGGLRIKDPALDLAVCLSVAGSLRDVAPPADCVLLGEVGLLGEIGRVPHLEIRLKEAAKAGFNYAFVPSRSLKDMKPIAGLTVEGVSNLHEAADKVLGKAR